MIRNLNPVAFQGFGTVPLVKAQGTKTFDKNAAVIYSLPETQALICRAMSDTWVAKGTGMSILSVSHDGESFQHFYLDKPACIQKGVLFALTAFRGEATGLLDAKEPPVRMGVRTLESLRVVPKLQVDSIYTFFYHEQEEGFLFPGESHPIVELTYVDRGSLHSVVDGQDLVLQQGDLVLYGPNQWHMQYADIGVAPRYVTISFDVCGMELSPLLNKKFSIPQNAVTLLQSMLRESDRLDEFSHDVILSELKLLLLMLLRENKTPRGTKLQASNAIHSENEIIRKAQQYVSTHIREKLSVPLVARQCDVSPSYLTALFHKNLQISPGEYIRRLKLQESKQMIRENNLNFTEIAAELQYSTVHHFSRQFKEKFGITPTEYAKSVR